MLLAVVPHHAAVRQSFGCNLKLESLPMLVILLHNGLLTILYPAGLMTSFVTRLEWGQWTMRRSWLVICPPSLCMSTASTQISNAGR